MLVVPRHLIWHAHVTRACHWGPPVDGHMVVLLRWHSCVAMYSIVDLATASHGATPPRLARPCDPAHAIGALPLLATWLCCCGGVLVATYNICRSGHRMLMVPRDPIWHACAPRTLPRPSHCWSHGCCGGLLVGAYDIVDGSNVVVAVQPMFSR